MFNGILIEKDEQGYRANLQSIDDSLLSSGDVTVKVSYSTLNYKDALAITGKAPVVRTFPIIPGIDLVSTVTVINLTLVMLSYSMVLVSVKIIVVAWRKKHV